MYVSIRDIGLPRSRRTGITEPRARSGRAVSSTVILLGLTSLFTDISSEMVAAILPIFATTQLLLTPIAYGVVDGLYQGVSTLVRVAGGAASDVSRRPKIIAASGYGVSAACKLALFPVASGAALAAVVAADRTGKGIRTAPRDALIAASTERHTLGYAFGVHRALDTAGALAGPLLAFALLAAIPGGFDQVFLVSFAAAVIGFAILVFLVPNHRIAPGPRPSIRSIVRLAVDRRLRWLLVIAGVLSVLTIGDGFLYLALQRRVDFAAEYFPLLFAGTAIAYLFLAVPFGRIADRFGRLRVFLAGHALLILAYALAAGAGSGVIGVVACLACLGAYYAATDGVLAAATASLVPEHLRGSGIALAQTVVAGGRLIAGLAFGAAWTWYGRDTALVGFATALLVAVVGAGIIAGYGQHQAKTGLRTGAGT